jgi:GNAT superfamily N-acetyltransferase
MHIRKINTLNKNDIIKFINFPHDLYHDQPNWIPPLFSELQLILNKNKHPFYKHSEADFFIAEHENEVLGRIAVLYNQNYAKHHHKKIAFFYYFESIEDQSVANALLKAAIDWCRERDLDLIYGPRGFLRSAGAGLLIEGFEYQPALGIPYNQPYYQKYIEDFGFVKETDYFSGYMTRGHHLPDKVHQIAERAKERFGFWIKKFKNKSEMREWIPIVDHVHHEAFKNNPGFFPSTEEEFQLIAETMIQVLDPRYLRVVMKGDELAGFIIAYANFSDGLKKANGRLFPFGWLHILLAKSRSKKVDLNGVGLLPKYQGKGANTVLYSELEKLIYDDSEFDLGEIVQVDEQNFRSKSDMETMGVNWCKRHRTYRYQIKETDL